MQGGSSHDAECVRGTRKERRAGLPRRVRKRPACGACAESDTSVDLRSGTVVPGCGRQDYDSGIGIGRGLSCLFSGTGVGAGFIPGSLWNVVGFIFVFGLILSAVLRRKEAESCSDEGIKKPPYIRMYGGLRAETAKVIPSVS